MQVMQQGWECQPGQSILEYSIGRLLTGTYARLAATLATPHCLRPGNFGPAGSGAQFCLDARRNVAMQMICVAQYSLPAVLHAPSVRRRNKMRPSCWVLAPYMPRFTDTTSPLPKFLSAGTQYCANDMKKVNVNLGTLVSPQHNTLRNEALKG